MFCQKYFFCATYVKFEDIRPEKEFIELTLNFLKKSALNKNKLKKINIINYRVS